MTRILKAQTFRALMVLSAIASSALVIEAGQRWK
jgi:NAD/NADP transhydrogenase alpha subunit